MSMDCKSGIIKIETWSILNAGLLLHLQTLITLKLSSNAFLATSAAELTKNTEKLQRRAYLLFYWLKLLIFRGKIYEKSSAAGGV